MRNSNIVVEETLIKLNSNNNSHEIGIPELVTAKDRLKLVLIIEDKNLDIHGDSEINL